ncbi:hypothetical protein MNEG_6083 [Monoraphidium neglectum]|uniref:FAD-binding domain-containing protein n=1 Tax=Monoraphidium neglectum TaxID=145388 RepID=A0A0D2MFG0_9CHLO|nr:hypothetical protein MNEG_6083 [Monoraphidium neglectum]KIZ01875.1 hypothetical protein MNEG_6083 [Monoraphidium neglectum]|eukprot:XP_013900894.1 hypothetical protein MNEG_6083 [Monoraphidium neglectum]
MLMATRSLVETELRLRVRRDCPRVKAFSGAVVEGLTMAPGDGGAAQGRVTGVKLRGGRVVPADLVVDASGRGSRTPEWLEAAGCATPDTVTVDSRLVYTSAVYELDPATHPGIHPVMVFTQPPDSRSGMLLPIEGGRHHLILTGRLGERCEGTDEAITQFAEDMPHPSLATALRGAKRIGDIRMYERTANFRRKYEEIDLPGGLVVLGDGVCAFNPVGQGMSVAVLEAVALGKQLEGALHSSARATPDAAPDASAQWLTAARGALPSATRTFMRGVGGLVAIPWALATGSDAVYVAGFEHTPTEKMINHIFMQISRMSRTDADAHATMMKVMHMLEPPAALTSPKMLLKLLVHTIRTALGGGGSRQGAGTA